MLPIELSDENERFIHDQLAEGAYRSCAELMNDALSQLRGYRDLMRRIEEGNEQLRNGQYLEVDEEGLTSFFENLKKEGRERAIRRSEQT